MFYWDTALLLPMRFCPLLPLLLSLLALPGWTQDPDYDPGRLERLVVDAINRTRQAHRLPALSLDHRLSDAARLHSHDLALTDRTGHRGSNGSRPIDRMRLQGARGHRFAENAFRGPLYAYRTRTEGPRGPHEEYRWEAPEQLARNVVDGWMRSPDHRQNLLDADLDRMGVGVAFDDEYRWIVTLNLSGD